MTKHTKFQRVNWEKWDGLLGTVPDQHLANRIGCDRTTVGIRRKYLGIDVYKDTKPPNETIKCACGCGEILDKYDHRGREKKFIRGHSGNRKKLGGYVACRNCGKQFYKPRWHIKRVNNHFCSQTCEGEYSTKDGRRRGKNNGHYNTIEANCAGGCGAIVKKAKSLVERRNGNVYCPDCIHLTKMGTKGFYEDYPPEFNNTLRKKIRKRDNYTCQECGKQQKKIGYTLHVHHIDYDKSNNSPSNLISLCRNCHGLTNFGHEAWESKFKAIMSHPVL